MGRTDKYKEVKKELVGVGKVGRDGICEMAETILTADLAEVTGPIRKDSGKAGIRQMRVGGMAAAVEAPAHRPPSINAIFGIGIETESVLGLKEIRYGQLIAGAPEEFTAEKERVIDGAAKWLPAKRGVCAIQI